MQQVKIILLGIISKVCIARTSGKTDGTLNHDEEWKCPLLSAKRAEAVASSGNSASAIDDRSFSSLSGELEEEGAF